MPCRNPKSKGNSFERACAKWCSVLLTGEPGSVWRESSSGAKSTRTGHDDALAGDLIPIGENKVAREFFEKHYVECKNVKIIKLDTKFFFGSSPLRKVWDDTVVKAKKLKKSAVLIWREAGGRDYLLTNSKTFPLGYTVPTVTLITVKPTQTLYLYQIRTKP